MLKFPDAAALFFFNVSHGIQIPKACIKIFFGDRSNMSIL